MKFLKSHQVKVLNRHLALKDQPIFWHYLTHYPKMNRFKLYIPLTIAMFFTGYYGYAYYFWATQYINILKHQTIYEWIQQPNFIFFWFISLFSPFILCLKTHTVFKFRYFIALLILLHAYPLFLYGVAIATAFFLSTVLYPLLFEYELGKTLP